TGGLSAKLKPNEIATKGGFTDFTCERNVNRIWLCRGIGIYEMTEKGKEIVEVLDDEVLVESNNDNNTDNIFTLKDDILGGDGVIVPKVGMKFKDEKELLDFYKRVLSTSSPPSPADLLELLQQRRSARRGIEPTSTPSILPRFVLDSNSLSLETMSMPLQGSKRLQLLPSPSPPHSALTMSEISENPKSDSLNFLEADNTKAAIEDDEYARILSRIAELEQEEEAEKANEFNRDNQIENDLACNTIQSFTDQEVRSSKVEDAILQSPSKDGSSHGKGPALDDYSMKKKVLELPEVKEKVQAPVTADNKVSHPSSIPGSDSSNAFTGSIVEHAPDIGKNSREQQTGARSSKPVSRFKMQRK
ncbi:Hypothetical predicted protein, partial [Olea europaea subsp. europaea]